MTNTPAWMTPGARVILARSPFTSQGPKISVTTVDRVLKTKVVFASGVELTTRGGEAHPHGWVSFTTDLGFHSSQVGVVAMDDADAVAAIQQLQKLRRAEAALRSAVTNYNSSGDVAAVVAAASALSESPRRADAISAVQALFRAEKTQFAPVDPGH